MTEEKNEFTVYGNPMAQGRPRFYRRGSFVGVYDPVKSKNWKSEVKRQAIENKVRVLEGALGMSLHFKLPRPKSLPKKFKHHTKKPDVDNLAKGIKDGLKGVCYKDDSQVVMLVVTKTYAESGEQTGVDVILAQISENRELSLTNVYR